MREVRIPLSLLPRVMIQVLWEALWKSLCKGLIESLSLSAYKYRKLNTKLCHDTRIAESRTVWYAGILHWFVSCSFLSILLLTRLVPLCVSLKGNACRFLKQIETFPGWNTDRKKIWIRSVLKLFSCNLQFHCRASRGNVFILWRRLDKLWAALCVNRLKTPEVLFISSWFVSFQDA